MYVDWLDAFPTFIYVRQNLKETFKYLRREQGVSAFDFRVQRGSPLLSQLRTSILQVADFAIDSP
jgi:hypothetical protein